MTPPSERSPSLGTVGLPSAVLALCQRLRDKGQRAWLVGGCVRDSLLGQLRGDAPVGSWVTKDWDVATDATPEAMMRIFRRVIPTGIEHGTVTVLLDKLHVEVTTLRAERGYADGRRPDRVEFVTDIEEDLSRRDFTVNAMAFEPLDLELVDPFGGLDDLRARRLRAVGEPERRFAEDGLRVLRAARFVATLEFELDPATASAIRPSLDTFRRVSAERIREEWNKTLAARAPSRGFVVMREHGLLEATAPELDRLRAVPWRASERLALAFARVDHTPRELELRLGALLRDLDSDPHRAAEAADALLGRLRYSNAERKRASRLVQHRELPLDPGITSAELRRWLRRAGPDLALDLCRLARAGLEGSRAFGSEALATEVAERLSALDAFEARAQAELAQNPPLSVGALAIDGKRLMADAGYTPGRQIGVALEALLEAVIEDPTRNTEAELLARARALREAAG